MALLSLSLCVPTEGFPYFFLPEASIWDLPLDIFETMPLVLRTVAAECQRGCQRHIAAIEEMWASPAFTPGRLCVPGIVGRK